MKTTFHTSFKTIMFAAAAVLGSTTTTAQELELPPDPQERAEWLRELLARYQFGAETGAGEAAPCLQADAERWQREVLQACTDDGCREQAHIARLAELHDIQPGVSQLSDWEPPPVPALIAVLAPEFPSEESGADLSETPDFEAEGLLAMASENIEHMGLALRAENDSEHVLVFDMDLGNQPLHGTLQALMNADPEARYRVRGHGEVAPDGIANFSPAYCRFIYRLPN
jgi:hypothetical protein